MTSTADRWAELQDALRRPSVASWERVALLLHRWPDPAQLAAAVRMLALWPGTIQRTPLRPWLQPGLDGEGTHPLLALSHAPGTWLLSVGARIGQLWESARDVLDEFDELDAQIDAMFTRLFCTLAPGYGQGGERDAYIDEEGVELVVTLSVVSHGWEIERREVRRRLSASLTVPPLSEDLRGDRFPVGCGWHGLDDPTALHIWEAREPDALSPPWFRTPRRAQSPIPEALRSRLSHHRPHERRLLVADGDRTIIHPLPPDSGGEADSMSLPVPLEALDLDVPTPAWTVLGRGADQMALYSLHDGARLRGWRWPSDGRARKPRSVRLFRAQGVAVYLADLGEEVQIRWSGQAATVRAAPDTPPAGESAAAMLSRLALWSGRPAVVDEILSAVGEAPTAEQLHAILVAQGAGERPALRLSVAGLLGRTPARERQCRAALDRMLDEGLLELEPPDRPTARAAALLVMGGALEQAHDAAALGALLGRSLVELPGVADLFGTDEELGRALLDAAGCG